MVSRRRKMFLGILTTELLIAIAAVILFQTPSPTESQAAPIVPGPMPPSLLVVPEVPFGTIAITLACFLALFIVLRRPKSKAA
jgi:hypothetical protein